MLTKLKNFFTRFLGVHVAVTSEEKEAIFRFRYKIYVKKMNIKFMQHIDHENQWAYEDMDNETNTYLIYCAFFSKVLGTARLRIWQPSTLPESMQLEYNMKLFPEINKRVVAEIGFLIVKKNWLSKWILYLILEKVYKLVLEAHIDLVFASCLPGLVKSYRPTGFSPYTSKLIQYHDALSVPLVALPFDTRYLKGIRSPYYHIGKKYLEKNPISNEVREYIKLYRIIIRENQHHFYFGKKMIKKILRRDCASLIRAELFKAISLNELVAISSMILHIEKEGTIFMSEIEDKEIYFILDGEMDILVDGSLLAKLLPGELFGEVAFFLDSAKRTAAVKAHSASNILVIRRNDLMRYVKNQPEFGVRFYQYILRQLAQRLKNSNERFIAK